MWRLAPWTVWVFALTHAAPAAAQAPKPALSQGLDGPRVQEIRAVERGLFVESAFGFSWFISELRERRYGLAPAFGVFIGYDLASIFNISIGARAAAAAGPDGPGTDPPRGDLFLVAPVVKLQLAIVTTERNFFWIIGEAGFGFMLPEQIDNQDFGGSGPLFAGAVGYEYFTELRHFSIGLQAGVMVITEPSRGLGVSLMPTLKYTF